MRHVLAILLLVAALAACQQARPPMEGPSQGEVSPTVAGGTDAAYASFQEARQAFTRSCGSLSAVLEDAAWIRLEPNPAEAEQRHRAYFEYGYTSFEITTRSLAFTQPTAEEFLLEDSLGARLTGRPITYEGAMRLEDNQWWTNRFTVSFQHTMTADVRWIRLTRLSDGSKVEWAFPAGGGRAPTLR